MLRRQVKAPAMRYLASLGVQAAAPFLPPRQPGLQEQQATLGLPDSRVLRGMDQQAPAAWQQAPRRQGTAQPAAQEAPPVLPWAQDRAPGVWPLQGRCSRAASAPRLLRRREALQRQERQPGRPSAQPAVVL